MYLLSIMVLMVMPTTAQRPPFRNSSPQVFRRRVVASEGASAAFSMGINRRADIPHASRVPVAITKPPLRKHTKMRLTRYVP